jgi:hypothetical protein
MYFSRCRCGGVQLDGENAYVGKLELRKFDAGHFRCQVIGAPLRLQLGDTGLGHLGNKRAGSAIGVFITGV